MAQWTETTNYSSLPNRFETGRKLKFERANTEFILQQQSQGESIGRNNLRYSRLNEILRKNYTEYLVEQELNYLERIVLSLQF